MNEHERADIEYDLADTRERLNDLLSAEPVSPQAEQTQGRHGPAGAGEHRPAGAAAL